MKKNGFTLLEVIGSIVILGIIALLAFPPLLNMIKNSEGEIDEATKQILFNSAKDYVASNQNAFPITKGNVYCITYNELMKDTNLNLKDVSQDTKIKVTIDDNNKYVYEVDNNCVEHILREYTDNSGANKPVLFGGAVPVIYKDNNWIVASTYEKWYDYDNKEWANIVVLENGVIKSVGDTLNIDTEVAMMYVWIPRYEYSIPEYNIGRIDNDIHAIDIKFIDKNKITADTGYNLHPGFKFGDDEVSGLWVGKFETTGATAGTQTNFTCTNENCTQKVTIKPNYKSGYGKVSNQFYATRSIQTQYGLTNVDTHMTRYTEWTTISYLTNSIYGRCSDATHCMEVTINNSSDNYTGNAGDTISAIMTSGIINAYDTAKGQLASTTGNITGAYDMSGCYREYVMGALLDSSTQLPMVKDSGFTSFPNSKYYDTFTSSDTSTYNYSVITHVNGVEGDYRGVFRELLASPYTSTTNFYGDYVKSVYASNPWFLMGGGNYGDKNSGLFASEYLSTVYEETAGFRVVAIPNN